MTTPKIELRNVSKTFHGEHRHVKALENISLEVKPGEFLTIIGPSGSGKSTLFNLIVGLLDPDEGEICFDGDTCHDRLGLVVRLEQLKRIDEVGPDDRVASDTYAGGLADVFPGEMIDDFVR